MTITVGQPLSYSLCKIINEFTTNKDLKQIAKELKVDLRTVTRLIYERSNITEKTKEAPYLMLKKAMINKGKLLQNSKEREAELREQVKEEKRRQRRLERIKFLDRN